MGEKLMRNKARSDPATAANTLSALNGAWRLVFTTGTASVQKKIGEINYFPLKAVQTFDSSDMSLTNGIYFGNLAALKFFGPFEFNMTTRKLEFDFFEIAVFGLKIDLGCAGVKAS